MTALNKTVLCWLPAAPQASLFHNRVAKGKRLSANLLVSRSSNDSVPDSLLESFDRG